MKVEALGVGVLGGWSSSRHIVKRGLDSTGKSRTGLRLVKRGLDSISKTRTGLC